MPIARPYYKVYRVFPDPEYVTIENLYSGNNTFTLTKQGTGGNAELLQYSLDKATWTSFSLTATETVTIPSGGKLYLRGTNPNGIGKDDSNYWKMSTSQNAKMYGNMATLLKYLYPDSVTYIPNYGFFGMFYQWSKLTDASGLNFVNITTVRTSGLYQAFSGCSSLTAAPDLSSITTVGKNGLYLAFSGCSSLTAAPDLSSITTVGDNGLFYAFSGCSSLTAAPDLSLVTTVGNNGLYYAFYNCSSLTAAPDLSSVTSVGSYGLGQAFAGCTSLNYVIAPSVSSWNTINFSSWLYNVASTGVVNKPAGLTIPTGTNGVPSGWTTEDR